MAALMDKMKYLDWGKHGYRYRRVVPDYARARLGRKVWIKTFRKGAPNELIKIEVERLTFQHDSILLAIRTNQPLPNEISEAEGIAQAWVDEPPHKKLELQAFLANEQSDNSKPSPYLNALQNALQNGGKYQAPTLLLSLAYDEDREKYGGDRDEKPISITVAQFISTIGDKPMTEISRRDVQHWLSTMKEKGLASSTAKRRLGALKAVFNRYRLDLETDVGLAPEIQISNPFEKQKIYGSEQNENESRLPLNRQMLARIEKYLETRSRGKPETRQIAILMMYTGARTKEIAGLSVNDLNLDGPIPYIHIRKNAVRGLKSGVSARRVPLVGAALHAAQEAVEHNRKSQKSSDSGSQLFASYGKGGRGADYLSSRLNKMIRAAGVPKSPRLVAYSLRHTMKEALRAASVRDDLQRRLLGHSGHGVADNYGSPSSNLAHARDALNAAIDCLGDIDDSFYGPDEKCHP